MNGEERSIRATRRAFLKAVGSAAVALPFFRMLEQSAIAQTTGTLPQKFVGVAYPHAKPARYYYRRPGETDTSYDLSYADCALRPFDKYKSRTIIFEGFGYGMGQGGAAGEIYVAMHGAMAMFLTASAAKAENGFMSWGMQNASLDHYLAQKYGGTTPFRSVELVGESDMGSSVGSYSGISAGDGGVLKTRLTSPEAIWNKFFGTFVPPGDPAAAAAAARRKAINASVLDYVAGDITRLNNKLAGTEKQKLDQHLTAVRDIERRIQSDPVLSASCTKPALHKASGPPMYKVANANNGGENYFDLIIDYQIELLAQMLICDITRFGTLVLPGVSGHGATNAEAAHTDLPCPYNFHDEIAHVSEGPIDVDKKQASMCRWYYSKVAKLMDYLDAAGALDSTLILVGNEGGHGSGHSHRNVPLTLHGGANGKVRMGRRILAPGRSAPKAEGDEPGGNDLTSHAPILVGIANAFGDPITSYGTCLAKPELTQGISGFLT